MTIDDIVVAVCAEMQLGKRSILDRCRFAHLVDARAAICWLSHKHSAASLSVVGKAIWLHHTTVLHHRMRIGASLEQYSPLLLRIEKRLLAGGHSHG